MDDPKDVKQTCAYLAVSIIDVQNLCHAVVNESLNLRSVPLVIYCEARSANVSTPRGISAKQWVINIEFLVQSFHQVLKLGALVAALSKETAFVGHLSDDNLNIK